MADEASPAEAAAQTGAAAPVAAPETDTAAVPGDVAAKPQGSEMVRIARENRRLARQLEELKAAPKPDAGALRGSVIAELKAIYEKDPEAFLSEVAGEDFVAMAKRVAKSGKDADPTVEELRSRLAKLEESGKGTDADRKKVAAAEHDARTKADMAEVSKLIEEAGADGEAKYPTLSTLDESALDEPISMTAINAVAHAWRAECCETLPDGRLKTDASGNLVLKKTWSQEEMRGRFDGALAALEGHYAKMRTPKAKTPIAQSPEPGQTITNEHASGVADRRGPPNTGTTDWRLAMRSALKERGLS